MPPRILHQLRRLIKAHRLRVQQCRQERFGLVALQPAAGVGQQRETGNITLFPTYLSLPDFTTQMLGGMFTMLMTIRQGYTIWVAHQAAGVSLLPWRAYLVSAVLWLWLGRRKQDRDISWSCIGWILLDAAMIVGVIVYG